MNFWEIIFLFFSFQAIILAFLFFLKKKGDKLANCLFGIYILLFSYNIFFNVLYWSKKLYTIDYISLLYTNIGPWILYGPILYLYVKRLVTKEKLKLVDGLHFLPFVLFLVNYSPYFLASLPEKIELLKEPSLTGRVYYFSPYFTKFYIAIMIFYFVLILGVLRNKLVSNNQKKWLNWLTFSYLGYVISFSTYFILRHYGFIEIGYDYFVGYAMIFFVGLVSYFGFLQPDVFNGLPVEKIIPFVKYQKTGLTRNHSLELKFRLQRFMENEKPFLNSELRLDDLADKLNLSRHHMSQVINEHFDTSFFDFVNKYRIEEAKKLLSEDEDLTVTDVLYSSGFNNRVSFYKAFKKFIGITPTEFKSLQDRAS